MFRRSPLRPFTLTNTPDLDPTQQGATDQQDMIDQLYQNILYDNGITQIVSNVGSDINTNTGTAALANYAQAGNYRPGNNNIGNESTLVNYVMDRSIYDDLMAAAPLRPTRQALGLHTTSFPPSLWSST